MVHHHDVRCLRSPARVEEETPVELGTARADAGVDRGVDIGPDPGLVVDERQFGAIAGLGVARPQAELNQCACLLRRGTLGATERLEASQTEIVAASLEERRCERRRATPGCCANDTGI